MSFKYLRANPTICVGLFGAKHFYCQQFKCDKNLRTKPTNCSLSYCASHQTIT
jgi:hypothetical protein